MLQKMIMFGTLLLIVMPFSLYAEETSGLDFYSRIDDAGDSLAQGIVSRRLSAKWDYGSLGCGATWLKWVRIDRQSFDRIRAGDPSILVSLATARGVTLTTDTQNQLTQCLIEKYDQMQSAAYQDQEILETVGSIGLYMDGDTTNSDYDIATDIARINSVIFKERYEYKWTKNATSQAVANMLKWGSIAPLFPSTNSGSVSSGSTNSWVTLPWAGVCRVGDTASDDLFGDGFFDDIDATLSDGVDRGGIEYTPSGVVASSLDAGIFWNSEKSDFYNTPSCDGIFCVKIDMVWGSQNALGGYSNTSIESLLEQHSKMMDPISWSDLSAQKMTMNSYELPFLNIKIANKIAGGRLYVSESPQITKNLKTEDTQVVKDARFDADLRCAMNEAWLSSDLILANGFLWAGYTQVTNTSQVSNKTIVLWAQEVESLTGCYSLRVGQGKQEGYQSFSTDLNEIQGFTSAMMDIIRQILDTDLKLDGLPTK